MRWRLFNTQVFHTYLVILEKLPKLAALVETFNLICVLKCAKKNWEITFEYKSRSNVTAIKYQFIHCPLANILSSANFIAFAHLFVNLLLSSTDSENTFDWMSSWKWHPSKCDEHQNTYANVLSVDVKLRHLNFQRLHAIFDFLLIVAAHKDVTLLKFNQQSP